MDSPPPAKMSSNTLQRQMDLSSNQRLHRRQVSHTPTMEEAFFTPLASPENVHSHPPRFPNKTVDQIIQKPMHMSSVIPQPFIQRSPPPQASNHQKFQYSSQSVTPASVMGSHVGPQVVSQPGSQAGSTTASPNPNHAVPTVPTVPTVPGMSGVPTGPAGPTGPTGSTGSSAPGVPGAPAPQSKPAKAKPRKCAKCQQSIYGHFVKALQDSYHINCFSCDDCGVLCAAKFFPVDGKPLCEHCYFKRQQLLCFRCGLSLRGSYVTALDRKYHVEHFTCSLCTTVFGPDDSYFEYKGDVYCRTHYGALFAFCCEGCKSPILKQYVETYRSSRQQQWHPECYMIYKFWNVKITDPKTAEITALRKDISAKARADLPLDPRAKIVMEHEDLLDKNTMRIWSVLCAYEESCASQISQLVQQTVDGNSFDAHASCTKLVDLVEVLFLDLNNLKIHELEENSDQVSERKRGTGREAKTLCRKIIGYMSLLSKTRKLEHEERVKSLASDLLVLTSSMAHYLKVLIRLGLSTALKKNMVSEFLMNLSLETRKQRTLNPISPFSSDRCCACNKAVEEKCIRHKTKGDKLWHCECFKTAEGKLLTPDTCKLEDKNQLVETEVNSQSEFVEISRLEQYVSLLRVALARLNLVLSSQRKSKTQLNELQQQAQQQSQQSQQLSQQLPQLPQPLPQQQEQHSQPSHSQPHSQPVPLKQIRKTKSGTITDENVHLDNTETESTNSRKTEEFTNGISELSIEDSKSKRDRANSQIDLDAVKTALTPIEIETTAGKSAVERTSSVLHGKNGLTLDDIRRIVAAEQARIPSADACNAAAVIETRSKTPVNFSAPQQAIHFGVLSSDEYQWVQLIAQALILKYTAKQIPLDGSTSSSKQANIWTRMNKVFNKESEGKVFGQPLDRLVSKYGADSNYGCGDRFEGTRYTLRIPSFVEDCVGSMRQKDMCVEGIFRKNGNIRRLREIVERIDKNPDDNAMLADENPIQLAALLKKFLRELPDPLMTSKLVHLWLKIPSVDPASQMELMQLLVCLLPKNNRSVLEVLSYFLNWVSSFAFVDDDSGSKMDVSNLATVLAPSVMLNAEESQIQTQTDNLNYKNAIETFRIIISNYTMVALVPTDVSSCLSKLRGQPPRKLSLKEVEACINGR